MDVYQAATAAKKWVIENTPANTVQTTGVIGIHRGEVVKFKNTGQATHLGNDGFLFSYIYRDGNVTVTPEN